MLLTDKLLPHFITAAKIIYVLEKVKKSVLKFYSSHPTHHTQILRATHQSQIPNPPRHTPIPNPKSLCPMPYALCPLLSALCSMPYALCSMLYALCSMLYALCSMPYALCSMPSALCPLLSALKGEFPENQPPFTEGAKLIFSGCKKSVFLGRTYN